MEVRGELAMPRSAMAAYNASGPKRTLMNPRNAAAGVLSLKDPADAAGRKLVFAAFDLDVDGSSARTSSSQTGSPRSASRRRR